MTMPTSRLWERQFEHLLFIPGKISRSPKNVDNYFLCDVGFFSDRESHHDDHVGNIQDFGQDFGQDIGQDIGQEARGRRAERVDAEK